MRPNFDLFPAIGFEVGMGNCPGEPISFKKSDCFVGGAGFDLHAVDRHDEFEPAAYLHVGLRLEDEQKFLRARLGVGVFGAQAYFIADKAIGNDELRLGFGGEVFTPALIGAPGIYVEHTTHTTGETNMFFGLRWSHIGLPMALSKAWNE